uniref:non-specific serine/threonine protein kinase n=1 Tax=Setaria digitata TaxID=48799 RepID=A0A915PSW5_9BILA
MEQNQVTSTVKKFSRRAFDAFRTVVWHFVKKTDVVDAVTVMDHLLRLLHITLSSKQQIMDDTTALSHRNFAADIIALLTLLLEKKSILVLKPHYCYSKDCPCLWLDCMQFCFNCIDKREYSSTFRTCSWILLQVARSAKYCSLMSLMEQMVGKITEMLREYMLSFHSGYKTFMLCDDFYVNIMRIFNELLFEFGAENYRLMKAHSEELCELIGRGWADTASFWQSRKFSDELIASLDEQSKFVETIFIMHHPDCLPGSLPLSNSVRALLDLILDKAVNCANGLSSFHKSTYRFGQIQLLPDGVVSLLARTFTLCVVQNIDDPDSCNSLFASIREKDERWCQIIEKLSVRWSHRLPLQLKKKFFMDIIQSSVLIKREELLVWYLQTVTSVAESSIIELLDKEHCTYLWKFTLSVIHSQSRTVSECAVRLLCKIVVPCTKRLGLDGTDVSKIIWSNISRLDFCTTGVACLLAHVLSNFEFDEHFEVQPVDESAVTGWSFRCAVLKFILKASTKPENVPADAVLEILCFIPDFHCESLKSDINKLERYLMNLFAIPILETPCRTARKKFFIRELVAFIGDNFMEMWENMKLENVEPGTLRRNQINLFFTVQNLFSCFCIHGEECNSLLRILKVMSSDLPQIIRSDRLIGTDEWLLTLGARGSWQAADEKLRNAICLELKEMTLQQLVDFQSGFANNKVQDWDKGMVSRSDRASEIVSNYIHEAVRRCSSFGEAVFTIEPFVKCGTVTERLKFIAILRSRAIQENDKSVRNVSEVVIGGLILRYLPMEKWKTCGILFRNLTTLHKSLHCSIWLDEVSLAKFVMNADLPDEFRANVVRNIYMPPLKHKIHIRILAFLVSVGTSCLYKQLMRIFPVFGAIIDLFLAAATNSYTVQPASSDGFLPVDEPKRFEVIRRVSASRPSFQRYVNGQEINAPHMFYLDTLFLLQEEISANITCLLDSWFGIYDLLLNLEYDLAVEKTYCVFDVFIENSYCKEQIMTRITVNDFSESDFRSEYLFKESLGRFNLLLCKTYWSWLYENFGRLKIKDSPQALCQILQIWSKYPTLRKFIAPCLTHFNSFYMGSLYHISPVNVTLEELIALDLLGIFFNPFELYPCEVYWCVCQILSCSLFAAYVNNSFSDASSQYVNVEDDSRSFAFALLPHLFAAVYNQGHDMSQFCTDVNYLLTNFPEKLINNDYPLIVDIVACIRQACVNLASESGFRKLPFDLPKLSRACLEINLENDANYFMHCYLDRLSEPTRPRMHGLNGNRGFFEMFDEEENVDKPGELFMETLTKIGDADSLRSLSLQIKDNSKCHMILAESQCNWSHLAAFSPTTDLKNLRSLAFYYAGLDIPPEFHDMASLACAELQKWDQSFLKMCCLLASNYKAKCNEIAKSLIISRNLLNDLSRCCEMKNLMEQNVPPVRGSILSCPWVVCKYGSERIPERILNPIIVARAECLYSKNAHERALQIIEKYRKFVTADENAYREYDITKARILKKCGYEQAARLLLSQICNMKSGTGLSSSNFLELSLKARMLLAEFDVEACRPDLAIEAMQVVVQNILNSGHENVLLLAKAYRKLAEYAETKLLSLENYCSSKTFKVKEAAIKKWEEELQRIKEEKQEKTLEEEMIFEERRIQKEKTFEEKELEQYCNDKNTLILTALNGYLASLELDANAVDIPYRILPFFVKAKHNKNLLEPLRIRLNRFQSRPWIPLISHLCSHFFDDAPLAPLVRKERLRRVKDLLREASTKDKSLKNPIIIMKKAFSLYAQFAASSVKIFQCKKYARSTASIADSVLLKEVRSLQNVPIPAIEQPLTDDSSQLITFVKINSVVTIADGITQPTIVTVTGSDGNIRKLIFKNEDLRQDSLVEQLFTVVNILLMDGQKTFPLRTYHVMPINSNAGIIEFCLGTVSLCDYICGADRKSGMHRKLYPLEMTAAAARLKLSEALFFLLIILLYTFVARANQSNLVETYKEICKNIHPVFRHFFYDRFMDSFEWCSRIKDYTISLARWSIVGYIVGLGDRHLNNIMVEEETGRLVHIDLGMVFEFGKRNLLIPERVPFRLTREIVDPILIEGVNGKFKNVAVNTLDCLRKNSQVLIGLALVLLHDSLAKYPKGESDSQFATLAVCRLRDKLAGMENRIYMDPLQQVSYLIKEATDPENLARMFAGWMPFL